VGGRDRDNARHQYRKGACAGGHRHRALRTVATGYEASAWYGIGAPKGTPVEIVDRLNTAMNESLADPKLKARLADLGATVLTGSSADLGKLIADETEKWAKVIEFAKIKAE